MLKYIMIISSLLAIALLSILAFLQIRQKRSMDQLEKEVWRRRKAAKLKKNEFASLVHGLDLVFQKVPFISFYLFQLKEGFKFIGEKDMEYLSYKAVKIMSFLLLAYLGMVISFYYITDNRLYSLLFMIFLWYILDSYIDFFINQGRHRLLRQLIHYLGHVRRKYYEYRCVDEALYEGISLLGRHEREMIGQAERIHDALTDADTELAITRYNETAPNPYLKMLMNIARMTQEYGDIKREGQSVFLMNLTAMSKSVEAELEKREKLNYALKSMNIIVLLPLFFITVLKQWATSNFAPLGIFYASSMGKYMEVASIVVMFLSMVLLNHIQRLDHSSPIEKKKNKWYMHIPLALDRLKKEQWAYGFITFFIAIIIFTTISQGQRMQLASQIYYSDSFLGSSYSDYDIGFRKLESEIDYEFLKLKRKSISVDEIETWIEEHPIMIEEEIVELEGRLERILYKLKEYEEARVQWWHVFISVILGLLGYQIPILNGLIIQRLRKLEIEDEIAGFQNLIMMLVFNPRMNSEEILGWMCDYANYYKEPLNKCLLSMSMGQELAYKNLLKDIEHIEMQKIIQQLSMASEDISIEEAFDELIREQSLFIERRKWMNERIVQRKILLGQNIGFMPAYSLIIFYMIIPMVVTSSRQLEQFMTNLSGW